MYPDKQSFTGINWKSQTCPAVRQKTSWYSWADMQISQAQNNKAGSVGWSLDTTAPVCYIQSVEQPVANVEIYAPPMYIKMVAP